MFKKLKDKILKEENSESKKISKVSEKESESEEIQKDKKEKDSLKTTKSQAMTKIVAETQNPPSLGDVIEGTVIEIDKAKVFIDLPPYGTGIIYGREFMSAKDVIKKMNVGDQVSAKVVDFDEEDGYIELSLKEARQALIWAEAEKAVKARTVFELEVKEANKGGLIIEWQGIAGFLPASQLKPEHYPKVQDGDKDRILEELKKLVGTKVSGCIITALPKEGKIIFSEKSPEKKEKEKMVGKYSVGDVLEGNITGIVDFGVFVKIEDGLEGLVHISETDWSLVDDLKTLFKVGQKVGVKVIEVKDGKISLSIKALKENPWTEAAKKYKKDDTVQGVVIKYNKHGAMASIEEGISGLIHVSEFESMEKLKQTLELGKSYKFKITVFDPKSQKMALSSSLDKK